MSLVVRTSEGIVTVPDSVLAQIVRRAAEAVDGARVRRPRRGLEVELDGGRAAVSLELAVRHGVVLPELAHQVQERVASALQTMCGVDVERVDLAIEEVEE
jgi:uncharacterized alkaline shock family protein YloU